MTTLPYNLEAEQCVLAILLKNNQAFESLPDELRSGHFYTGLHQKLFEAISFLIKKGQLANPVTLNQYLKSYLDKEDPTQEATSVDYLSQLASLMIPSFNIHDYGRLVYDLHLRRELIHLSQQAVERACDQDIQAPDASAQIETLEGQLFSLASHREYKTCQDFSSALAEAIASAQIAYQRDSHVVGVTTGFLDLDKMLGGLHPSDLVILAGRPSMGKSALATNIAFNAALAKLKNPVKGSGAGVAFFSLEMSSLQLALRILGQETGISSDRIRRGAIDQSAFPSFLELSQNLSRLPLFLDDTPALTISGLLTRARRLKRKESIGLIIIDYLQLLSSDRRGSENRVQELSEITRGLKNLAKQLEVPVIALSQLSRAVEQREDKRPMLSDLRESGTIEQDADVVMFIYREEYYESRNKPQEGSEKMVLWQKHMTEVYNLAEIMIAKQRHGPIGSIFLHFDGQKTKFSNSTAKKDLKS
jgi:replicative DNA helicase